MRHVHVPVVWLRRERSAELPGAAPPEAGQAIVLGGRLLKWQGRACCTADQPVHLAVNWEAGLNAHVWTSVATQLRFAVDRAPDKLSIDGRPAPVHYEAGQLLLDLAVGKHQVTTQVWSAPANRGTVDTLRRSCGGLARAPRLEPSPRNRWHRRLAGGFLWLWR